jgi:hypothetical protein
MSKPNIYADFHNADSQGRLRLNAVWTLEDLSRQRVELHPGLQLTLYSDDLDDQGQLDELLVEGVVSYSEEEHCWVASVDWAAIRHASDRAGTPATENGPPAPSKESGRTKRAV